MGRLRHDDRAFGGRLQVDTPTESSIRMHRASGKDYCELEADLVSGRSLITTCHNGVELQFAP